MSCHPLGALISPLLSRCPVIGQGCLRVGACAWGCVRVREVMCVCVKLCACSWGWHLFPPTHKTIKTLGKDIVSAAEYVRSVNAVWRTSSCTIKDKYDILLDSIDDHTRRLLKVYVSSNNPDDMLQAILKLHGLTKSAQEFTTTFYSMLQGTHQAVAAYKVAVPSRCSN